jgi:hypothetical protein
MKSSIYQNLFVCPRAIRSIDNIHLDLLSFQVILRSISNLSTQNHVPFRASSNMDYRKFRPEKDTPTQYTYGSTFGFLNIRDRPGDQASLRAFMSSVYLPLARTYMAQTGRTNAVLMLRSSTLRRLVRKGIIAGIPRLTPFIHAQASQAELPDIIYNIVLIMRRVEPDYWMNLTPGALIYELVANEWVEGLPSAAAQGLVAPPPAVAAHSPAAAAPKQTTAKSAQRKRPRSGGDDDAPASKKRAPGADDESEEDEPEDIEPEDIEQEDIEQEDDEQGDDEQGDDEYYEEKP